MTTKLMSIFTRTPLHVGCGASVGAVDAPITRERHTRFPVIPGSSIKGVLADLWLDENFQRNDDGKVYFGEDNNDAKAKAGKLAFGEAKLLAFPVRSAKGCFAFITSPLCLERFKRDSGLNLLVPELGQGQKCLAGSDVVFAEQNAVILEEYRFNNCGEFPSDWAEKLTTLADDAVLNGGKNRFVLINDEDMKFFAENACQISQHVSINSQTGTAENGKLFNQEEVPSETLFYASITELDKNVDYTNFINKFKETSLVQFGGKGTTGIGYCSVKLI